jgi:hypothetical protein
MNAFETLITLIATAIVLSHCLTVAADIKRHAWDGHLIEFTAFTLSVAALGAGAAGVLLGWHHAVSMLLIGIAGTVAVDRRKRRHHIIKE